MAKLTNKQLEKIDHLTRRLDNSGLHQYVKLSQNKGKILWLNFLSGIARGLGFTLGTTIVLAVVYKIVSELISLNIPYITELLTELVNLVKNVAESSPTQGPPLP